MNRQIIIRTVVAFTISLSVSSQPIVVQNQIFSIGKLGYANVDSIAWSSNGTLLAVANGLTIDLIDTVSYNRVALLTGYTQEVLSVTFSPDGRWLEAGVMTIQSSSGIRATGLKSFRLPDTQIGSVQLRFHRTVAGW